MSSAISADKKKAMLAALESTLGVVSSAAKQAQIDRQTHYNWMKSDEEYAEAVRELKNVSIDFAESKLFGQIREGNTTAIIFYLKTIGKERGYVERSEHTITNDKPAIWFTPVPEGYDGRSEA